MLAVGRGGMDASFKLTRQEITAAYDAGPDHAGLGPVGSS